MAHIEATYRHQGHGCKQDGETVVLMHAIIAEADVYCPIPPACADDEAPSFGSTLLLVDISRVDA